MLLSWNYTLELFFWIIIGAVALVSLTILLAGPKFRAKVTKLSEETLSLTGKYVNSYNQKTVTRNLNSSKIEEDDYFVEEKEKNNISKKRASFYVKMKVYCIIFLYSVYSFFISLFGVLILFLELEQSKFIQADVGASRGEFIPMCYGFGFLYSGFGSLYGFLINDKKIMKLYCRITSIIFLLLPLEEFVDGGWLGLGGGEDWFGFVLYACVPLIFSGDLKQLWVRIYYGKKDKIVSEKKSASYGQIIYVPYSLLLILSAAFLPLNYENFLLIYFLGGPLFLCGFFNLYYFIINDKKNMQLWNRFTAATVFGGCFFMLIWVKMFTLGLLGLYLSTLIPLYFSGDLKQLKIWATDPDAMDLATVPLWWLIGLSFLMLWIIIAMLLF